MTQEILKLALEAMESVTVECNNFHHPKRDQNHHWAKCPPVVRWDKAIAAIKEALAQPEQFCDANCVWTDHHPDCKLAQPEQEAVGYWKEHAQGMERDYDSLLADYEKLAQRTFVGLTEQQRNDIENDFEVVVSKHVFDAIEAKLRSKNGY